MSISELTLKTKDDEPVRRFEVFTGSGRRREWSDELKAQIVAESYEPGVTVSSVARRHGLTSQQLFTWRRLARKPLDVLPDEAPRFAPAVVVAQDMPMPKKVRRARSPRKAHGDAVIELDIGGATIRIASGADARPRMQDGAMHLTSAQFSALFEGLDWKRVHAPSETRTPVQAG